MRKHLWEKPRVVILPSILLLAIVMMTSCGSTTDSASTVKQNQFVTQSKSEVTRDVTMHVVVDKETGARYIVLTSFGEGVAITPYVESGLDH